jgi:hypothetical protein
MAGFSHYEPCPRCTSLGRDTRGDNLAVYQDGGAHCFSCKYHRFPKYFISVKKELNNGPKNLCPPDFSREIPAAAWEWLLQYGLPYSYWKESVGYSAEENRLIFRVGDPLQFSIGRLIETGESSPLLRRPGELPLDGRNSAKRRKWYVWGNSHSHCEIVNEGCASPITLVEDLISAHKVGQVATAIPLFGTAIHPCHLWYLQTAKRSIVLWLDKDQEQSVKKQATWLQLMTSVPVSIKITDDDPKKYSINQIKDLLKDIK